MTFLLRTLVIVCLFTPGVRANAIDRALQPNGDLVVQSITFSVPSGWTLKQDALSDQTILMGFKKGTEAFTLYVKKGPAIDLKKMFVNQSQVVSQIATETHGAFSWNVIQTERKLASAHYYVYGFTTKIGDANYTGYGRSDSQANAQQVATGFLTTAHLNSKDQFGRSLTGTDYSGKKYYFGFGDKLTGSMGNEVKYDVQHTNDIFTKDVGGGYLGKSMIGTSQSSIDGEWNNLKKVMTSEDMYVQYSSGHGSNHGLMAGVSYRDICDNALSYPAKEIIIFTMACHSGALVDSFNAKKKEWEDFDSMGRTLFVMTSSKASQDSMTGPGTDPDEPHGPNGSAGSAFGHYLWKALIGFADGYTDGVKDGFISLEEIRDYVHDLTQKYSHQTPVFTGSFNPTLIINRVPPKSVRDRILQTGLDQLSQEEIFSQIRQLDNSF
jgi:hypothetical protein